MLRSRCRIILIIITLDYGDRNRIHHECAMLRTQPPQGNWLTGSRDDGDGGGGGGGGGAAPTDDGGAWKISPRKWGRWCRAACLRAVSSEALPLPTVPPRVDDEPEELGPPAGVRPARRGAAALLREHHPGSVAAHARRGRGGTGRRRRGSLCGGDGGRRQRLRRRRRAIRRRARDVRVTRQAGRGGGGGGRGGGRARSVVARPVGASVRNTPPDLRCG